VDRLPLELDDMLRERHSRITVAVAHKNLKADPIAQSLTQMLEPFAPELRQSITFDNPVLSACLAGNRRGH
jgi:IS30 family transposase